MLNYDVKTGRLTADPELRNTPSNVPVVNFTLAVQRNYKVNDEYPVDFINFVAWRGTAEFICNNFRKGSMITVEGSLETRKYEDKDNPGKMRTAYEIKVDRAHFGDSGNRQNNGNANDNADSGFGNNFEPDFPSEGGADDDLPFDNGFPALDL